MRQIAHGYLFGLALGLLYCAFRYQWGDDLSGLERIAITLMCSMFVTGPIGTVGGFLVAFIQDSRRHIKERPTQLVN